MRKWLIEETGEVRCPKHGEYFLDPYMGVTACYFQYEEYPILRVRELTDEDCIVRPRVISIKDFLGECYREDEPYSSFDEWNW